MRISIGVDPDTTVTAVAIVDIEPDTPKLLAAYMVKQKGSKERKATLAMSDMVMGMLEKRVELFPVPELIEVVVVEGQELYLGNEIDDTWDGRTTIKNRKTKKKTPNPRSILWLAPISGLWIMFLRIIAPNAMRLFPAPAAWKGQTPKPIHHARIGKAMGWKMAKASGYCFPDEGENVVPMGTKINKGDWKHLMDAIGLALWGGKELKKAEAKEKALAATENK